MSILTRIFDNSSNVCYQKVESPELKRKHTSQQVKVKDPRTARLEPPTAAYIENTLPSQDLSGPS